MLRRKRRQHRLQHDRYEQKFGNASKKWREIFHRRHYMSAKVFKLSVDASFTDEGFFSVK
jgi:hypothetical protein